MRKYEVSASYALRIAVPYFIVSMAWILFSDQFVAGISPDMDTMTTLQTYKGWFYLTASAIFVYFTSRHYLGRLARSQQEISAKETALTENEQGMFSLMGNLPGMAYRCSPDGDRRMEYVSEKCKLICGRDPDELTGDHGKPWNLIILAEDREMVGHEIKQAVRDRSTFRLEYRIVTSQGGTKWVSEQGCLVRSATADRSLLVGYIFEIDEANRPVTDYNMSSKRERPVPQPVVAEQSVSQSSNLMGRPL